MAGNPFGLAYGSDDEHATGSASFSSSQASDVSSVDSATHRAQAAAARLKDYDEPLKARPGTATALPSAFSAFDEVSGPPEFLDPEAIRPLATSSVHASGATLIGGAQDDGASGTADKGGLPGPGFDIARLAPAIKGQKKDEAEERGLPSGSIIQGKAKRYKAEDAPEYTAVQIAMMGGNVSDKLVAGSAGGVGPARPPGPDAPRVPSKAMAVTDFLDKGIGGSLLPRKAQDRRDKEKSKRERGQSSIGSWKTEAEMVLRQQFDS